MRYFATYFDIHYAARAACLLESLAEHAPDFRLYALCLDEASFGRAAGWGNERVVPMGLPDLEAAVPELAAVKPVRTRLEYYYTCGPAFLSRIMDLEPGIDVLTYLDADLYFLSDPMPLFRELEGHSIGVVPHHQPARRKGIWQGIYNVGWINFRRDAEGRACLEWWKARCLEWCFERYEDGKYADQLYLDQWPGLFPGFHAITHHGANVGAWNVRDYRFSLREGRVHADDDPLIFYHFHGFKKIAGRIYDTNLGLSLRPPGRTLKRHVFLKYIRRLEHFSAGGDPTASIRRYRARHHVAKSLGRLALGIVFRQYMFVRKERPA